MFLGLYEQRNKNNNARESERISSNCNARLKMQKSLTNDCLYHQWHSAIQYIIIANFDRSTKKNWYWQLEKEQTFQPFWQKPLKRHVNYLLVFKPPKSWIYISFRKLFLWSYFPVHFVNKDIEVITEQIQNHTYFTKYVKGKKKRKKI